FLLSQFLPKNASKGSISTLSGTFKPEHHSTDILQKIARQQLEMVPFLKELEEKTGKQIAIALEPEPFNTLETTEEVITYFHDYLFPCAKETYGPLFGKKTEETVTRYLGICYDTCHQACQFEDLPESLLRLKNAGIPIHKVQLSNALHLPSPKHNPAGIEKLKTFQEPVYLHQLIGKRQNHRDRVRDLSDFFETIYPKNPEYWNQMEAWRVHFHVPLFYRGSDELQTTQKDLNLAIQTLLSEELTQHFEIETYTWDVIPIEERQKLRKTLTDGLIREFEYVLEQFSKNQVLCIKTERIQ
ncbi:MAG: metabolite traffic protein EboE, partial [Planctomycetota bacterium]